MCVRACVRACVFACLHRCRHGQLCVPTTCLNTHTHTNTHIYTNIGTRKKTHMPKRLILLAFCCTRAGPRACARAQGAHLENVVCKSDSLTVGARPPMNSVVFPSASCRSVGEGKEFQHPRDPLLGVEW